MFRNNFETKQVETNDSHYFIHHYYNEMLKTSQEPLANMKLTLPPQTPEFLEFDFVSTDEEVGKNLEFQNGCIFPFSCGPVFEASIKKAVRLTYGEDVKNITDICLDLQQTEQSFEPGDTLGILPSNPVGEVEAILEHLGLLEQADKVIQIKIKSDTLRRKPYIPPYIPESSTLRYILQNCLEIRAVPKKAFIRNLAVYTKDPEERRRLEELCSRQGASDYTQYILDCGTTLLDLLKTFPSCHPPFTCLVEHLPRLLARPYSVASSPLVNSELCREVHIVYSSVTVPSVQPRGGVCTSWLDTLTMPLLANDVTDISKHFEQLQLEPETKDIKIPVYFRKNRGFKLPEDTSTPLILIGPGTGVAPFIGFLQHRMMQRKLCSDLKFGEIWLFFGCRYEARDYIFKSELQNYQKEGILTRLFVSFSRDKRDEKAPKYVQDNIKLISKEFVSQVLDKNSTIYVCGDAKNMGKDVLETICNLFHSEKGISQEEAHNIITRMKKDNRYIEDLWL